MSNGCWTIVTPLFLDGSMPFFVSAAKSSYSLPPSQFATFLPFIFAIVLMPERLPRQLRHARACEDLRDVDEVGALVARREQARQPVDAELRLAAGDDLLGDDVRARRS